MQHSELNIEILSWQVLDGIPSASGIVKFKEGFYVIGDDSPYLFHLDKNFDLISKTPISSSENLKDQIIPKRDKPDFEAMEMISPTEILVFGSGSKSPERDVCALIEIGEEISYQSYNISIFYQHIKQMDIMQGHELDIEALASVGDVLYLFNRGQNIIFSFSRSNFLAYCKTGTAFPILKAHLYSLPKIKGLKAGFSGATSFQNQPYLIFTASVEDSPNAYDDGAILGSFIGVIKISNGQLDKDLLIQQIPNPGFPLKVESVIVDQILSDLQTDLVLVTDNDGAPSQILRLRMTLDKKNTRNR